MKVDFDKYKILRLVQTNYINPTQLREMHKTRTLMSLMENTAERMRREVINRFVKVTERLNDDVVEVKADCYVVNYEDLLRMVKDAYAAGLRSKEYWARYDITPPTMED